MKLAVLVLALAQSACVSAPRGGEGGVVGTWRLVAYEDRAAGQPVEYPYGEQPKGLLIYDATGHMAIQIMKTPHPKVASGDDSVVTDEEKLALFDAYTAYWGRYRIDRGQSVVITRVEGDIADVFIGRDEVRPFTLAGDILTLTPTWESEGVRWTGLRVFERVK